ncbi:glutamine-hydrolyzing carbamoyl-phosphate synthase small subunit [Candidatus Berkiella cookevillensis]|uniref:Carbamoyl phosphate synthase small chain n=1 Tax=Candidatus Berkiella cookevillensis TaxID=437022 RepID=A0A0Q9YDL5_9GAMM|nr:glutamine-hydrolyzing carbamoyl-phosphate synthase small subunit [Candidatus Berkiella cookevillensis]MCS5707825.1 glutamine-hydrolyzing carbamoyl-phosphate synthase small subunit [Candidatus Berkiella cookevillensis]
MTNHPAVLALEDGTIFKGIAFGHITEAICLSVGEVVFNTSISGYQEIITDPSYTDQIITLTYPQIGNVGISTEDRESNRIYAKGLIVRQLPKQTSNWRSQLTLTQFLAEQKIIGLANIDTRALTRVLREKGALNGCIVAAPVIDESLIQSAVAKAKSFEGLNGKNLAKTVSVTEPYVWKEGGFWDSPKPQKNATEKHFKVLVLDYGIKKTILRVLDELGCHLQVMPYDTTAEEILQYNPDGVFLSNGPGDPKACTTAIRTIQALVNEKIPLFGICLGFQLLGLALGAKTIKMKFGHHGGNHPVQCESTKQVYITSQNHGFAVDEATLPINLLTTHRSLFDRTLQGFRHKDLPIFGFQGHPEAGPGPNDARVLFQTFIDSMLSYQKNKDALKLTMVTE